MAAGTNDQWWHEHQRERSSEPATAAAAAESEHPEDPPSPPRQDAEEPPARRMEDMLAALRTTRETVERLVNELETTEHDLHEWNAERLDQELRQQKLRSEPSVAAPTTFTTLESIPWHLKVQCYIEFWDKFLHQLAPSKQHSRNVPALSFFASNVWGETRLSTQEIYRAGPIVLFHDVLPQEQEQQVEAVGSNNVLNLMASQPQQQLQQPQMQASRASEAVRPPPISVIAAPAPVAPRAPAPRASAVAPAAPRAPVPAPKASTVAPAAQQAPTLAPTTITPSPAPKNAVVTVSIPVPTAPNSKAPPRVPKAPTSRSDPPKTPVVPVSRAPAVAPRVQVAVPRPPAPTPKAPAHKAPAPKAPSPKTSLSKVPSPKASASKSPAPVTTSVLGSVSYETASAKMPSSPGGWKRVKLRIHRSLVPTVVPSKASSSTKVVRLYSRATRRTPSVTPSSESSRGSYPRSLSPSLRVKKERVKEATRAKPQSAAICFLSSSEEEKDNEPTMTDLALLPPEVAKLRQQILQAIKPYCEDVSAIQWPFRALRFPSEFLFYDPDEHPLLARDHERFWSTYSPVYLEYVYHHPADVNERRRVAAGKANLLRAQQKLLSKCIEAMGIREVAQSFTNKYASSVFFFVKDYLSLDRLTPAQLKTHLESVCEPWGSPVVSDRTVSWWEMLLRRERGQRAHLRVNIGISSRAKEMIATAHFNGELQFDDTWMGLCCLEPWKSMLELHFVDDARPQGQKRPLDQAKKLRVKRSEQYDSEDDSFSVDSSSSEEERTQLRRAKGRYKRMRGAD